MTVTFLIKYKCFDDDDDGFLDEFGFDDLEDQYYFHHANSYSTIERTKALSGLAKALGVKSRLIATKEILFTLEGHVRVLE